MLSGIIGAFIGGLFSLSALFFQRRMEKKEKIIEGKRRNITILNGVRTEIELITSLHRKRTDEYISEHISGTAFDYFYKIEQNYFVFFEKNANHIADLTQSSVNSIINFYMICKGLIDSFSLNNDFLLERIKVNHSLALYPENENYKNLMNGMIEIGIKYSEAILAINAEALHASSEALKKIDEEISIIELEILNME